MIDVRTANAAQAWHAAAGFLALDAIGNAQLLQLVTVAQSLGRSPMPILVAYDGGTVVGVATAGPMVLLQAASPAATTALADGVAHRVDSLRVLIAEPPTAERVCARIAEMRELAHPTRDVPHHILVMHAAAPRASRQPRAPTMRVRTAQPADAPTVVELVGELTQTELGYDPRLRPTFSTSIRAQIDRGQFYIAHRAENAELLALCSVSIRNAQTVRIDNFVVPADLRGRGYGKAAAAAFSDFFIQTTPAVSVLVRLENTVAQAVYAATGFHFYGALRYLYFI